MGDFIHLNPDDFRRWIKKKEDQEDQDAWMVGRKVDPKFCGKKTARNISLESGKAGRVVREFVQAGGVIKSVCGDEVLVEVDSGSFYICKKKVIF
jgi:hypothetical protein